MTKTVTLLQPTLQSVLQTIVKLFSYPPEAVNGWSKTWVPGENRPMSVLVKQPEEVDGVVLLSSTWDASTFRGSWSCSYSTSRQLYPPPI